MTEGTSPGLREGGLWGLHCHSKFISRHMGQLITLINRVSAPTANLIIENKNDYSLTGSKAFTNTPNGLELNNF